MPSLRPRALLAAALFAALLALVIVRVGRTYQRCSGALVRLDRVESCGACGVRCAAVHAQAACVDGKCEIACFSGFADCDGHPGNGCEVDLSRDRAHCGACIKHCGGAYCEAGRCVGRLIGSGTHIAADERAVYSLVPVVIKFPVDGSDPITLGPGDVPPAIARAKASPPPSGKLQLKSGDDLYSAEPGPQGASIKRTPSAGGEAVTVVSHPIGIKALCDNSTHVFWADDKQRIFMAPKR